MIPRIYSGAFPREYKEIPAQGREIKTPLIMKTKLKTILRSEGKLIAVVLVYLLAIGLVAKSLPLEEWIGQIHNTGFWFLILYWLIFVFRGFFLFPPVYFLLGVILIFDFWEAIGVFLIGILLSATCSYLVGRWFCSSRIFHRIQQRSEKSFILQKMKTHGYRTIFLINIMGINFDIPNHLAGYFRLKYVLFLPLILLTNTFTTLIFATIIYPLQQRMMG